MKIAYGDISADIEVQDIKDILSAINPIKKRIKKNEEDKIGIIIGITTEQKEERYRVDNDLIKEIKSFLNTENLVGLFNIIRLDEEESSRIDNQNWEKILREHKSHLIIYGHIAARNQNTGYSLKLEAGVLHKPIPKIVSNILSNEFTNLFPRERFIPTNDEILGFEVAAKEIALVAQYMIGVAFFLSGYLGFSFQILQSLKTKVDSISGEVLPLNSQLKYKIQDRIVNVSLAICALLYDSFVIKRDAELIRDSKKYIDILNNSNANKTLYKHLESMYYFVIEQNVDRAILIYKTFDDSMRTYNLGFLHFFKGEIKNGLHYYRKAFKRAISSSSMIEMEIFISEILEKYPEKHELLFARALINFKGKEDYGLAKDDFNDFIKQSYFDKKYDDLRKLAWEYKNDAQRKL